MAVPSQLSGSMVILRKNSATALFDEEVASIKFAVGIDAPVCVVWDE